MMELEEPLQPIPSRTSHIDGVTARPAHGVLPPAAPLEREREAMEFGECSQSIPPRGSNTDGGAAQPVQGAQDPQHPISYYHGSQEVESAPPEPAVNVEQRQDTEVVQQPNGASNGGFHAEHVTALLNASNLYCCGPSSCLSGGEDEGFHRLECVVDASWRLARIVKWLNEGGVLFGLASHHGKKEYGDSGDKSRNQKERSPVTKRNSNQENGQHPCLIGTSSSTAIASYHDPLPPDLLKSDADFKLVFAVAAVGENIRTNWNSASGTGISPFLSVRQMLEVSAAA
ncbi:hypothetical protein B0T21DRAFT_347870 [Apiosordaria backusii]|uniref:Uncharacterized protein n=1 Tax=Apiosordaria backusii TaxID=314023 RepID=A0AA40BNJ2_9PEZI|nr:hypothetical protein B0T21DRAFT_347870 [Apiosordaria backusii]